MPEPKRDTKITGSQAAPGEKLFVKREFEDFETNMVMAKCVKRMRPAMVREPRTMA